jgi:4-hydroxybenzoate polyprenyltransferase
VNLSLSGFVGLLAVDFYLDIDLDLWVGLALMCSIFSVYTFNCFTDRVEDSADRSKYISKNINYRLYQLAIITFAVGTIIFIFHCFSAIKILLFATVALVSIAYSYRIIPGFTSDRHRIKEITAVKNIAIALCWTCSILISPFVFSNEKIDLDYSFTLLLISLFILIFVNSLFGDIRDKAGDKLAGVRTIPVVFGRSACYRSIVLLSGLWLSWIISSYAHHAIDRDYFCFLSAVGIYPLSYFMAYHWGVKSTFILDIICEFDVWFFSIGLLLLSN